MPEKVDHGNGGVGIGGADAGMPNSWVSGSGGGLESPPEIEEWPEMARLSHWELPLSCGSSQSLEQVVLDNGDVEGGGADTADALKPFRKLVAGHPEAGLVPRRREAIIRDMMARIAQQFSTLSTLSTGSTGSTGSILQVGSRRTRPEGTGGV